MSSSAGGRLQVLLDNLPLLLVASVFAPLTAWFAAQRARNPGVWFVFGALLGPLAVGLLALAPPGRCSACGTRVHGWITTCLACDRPLGGVGDPVGPFSMLQSSDPLDGSADGMDDAPRRVGAQARVSSPRARRSAATARDREASDRHGGIGAEVLCTGIYMSGNAGLEIGGCYALARLRAPDGDRLRVFGPVDTGQITVRHERLIEDLEITVLTDRVIVSGRRDRSSPTFVFQAVGGIRGEALERAFEPIIPERT